MLHDVLPGGTALSSSRQLALFRDGPHFVMACFGASGPLC